MAEKTHFSRSLTSRGDYLHKDQVEEYLKCLMSLYFFVLFATLSLSSLYLAKVVHTGIGTVKIINDNVADVMII